MKCGRRCERDELKEKRKPPAVNVDVLIQTVASVPGQPAYVPRVAQSFIALRLVSVRSRTQYCRYVSANLRVTWENDKKSGRERNHGPFLASADRFWAAVMSSPDRGVEAKCSPARILEEALLVTPGRGDTNAALRCQEMPNTSVVSWSDSCDVDGNVTSESNKE